MHTIRGQALPSTYLEHPYEKNDAEKKSTTSLVTSHDAEAKRKEKGKEVKPTKEKKKSKKDDKEHKGISSMVSASLMTATMSMPTATAAAATASPTTTTSTTTTWTSSATTTGRDRSGSSTSMRSLKSSLGATNKDDKQAGGAHTSTSTTSTTTITTASRVTTSALLPPLLPRNSLDNSSIHSHSSVRLPSIFKRRKHSTASIESSSSSTHSSQQHLSAPNAQSSPSQKQQHTILMAPQKDIHITWPYAVPNGKAFVAGTWSVPGHGPWEKLPMSLVPGTTDQYEVLLNVQEIEDISDYLDEDGYLHHELLEHHHAHDEHVTAITTANSAPSTPASTPPATLSKRQRIRRFFGRGRSSSTATASSSTLSAKDSHLDLPYHHQSKDGIILPLSREYKYQFKFVIDDDWKCDPNRTQVQDSEGHWNHELVVELIEQIHQRPTSAAVEAAIVNRSRSSSIQSQTPATPLPTKNNDKQGKEVEQEQEVEVKVTAKQESHDTEVREMMHSPPPPYSAPLGPLTSDQSEVVRKTTTKAARDTYEAVLIFDEKDDLSDGEGGRVLRDDDDDSDDDMDSFSPESDDRAVEEAHPHQQELQQQIFGDDAPAGDVTPQQDDDKAQPQQEAMGDLAALDTQEDSHDNIGTFMLQASVNPEENDADSHQISSDDGINYESELEEEMEEATTTTSARALSTRESRVVLEVITDSGATVGAVGAVGAAVAVTEVATSYSQVPSPPLTPSMDQPHHSVDIMETKTKLEMETGTERERQGSFRSAVLLTPRSEMPTSMMTAQVEENEEDEKTFDILEDGDHDSIHLHSRSSSSVSSSSSRLSTSSSSSTSSSPLTEKRDENENENEKGTRKMPEQLPSLFWSFCKTTVVVSAAVVVLGVGLGRRRD
ncbi:hypothetical protein BGX28_006684 [Mortierella sp. GBA30]|nr:hypothetical protein BGX28_006684 [Mortierella sp. GBA30]